MRPRSIAFTLVSFGFVFDSCVLGLAKANPQLLQTAWAGPMAPFVAAMMHSMSLPLLVLVYLGTICDILLVGRISSYLRGRIHHGWPYRQRLDQKRGNVESVP